MKAIRIGHSDDANVGDKQRIVEAMHSAGFACTHAQAKVLWEKYSDSMCAGWMRLPDDATEILGCVEPYFVADAEGE